MTFYETEIILHKPRNERTFVCIVWTGQSDNGGKLRGVNRDAVFAYDMAKEGDRRTNEIAFSQFAIKLIGT